VEARLARQRARQPTPFPSAPVRPVRAFWVFNQLHSAKKRLCECCSRCWSSCFVVRARTPRAPGMPQVRSPVTDRDLQEMLSNHGRIPIKKRTVSRLPLIIRTEAGNSRTKNGRAIYKSPNGKDCYKTERGGVAFELRGQKTIPVYFSAQANSIRSHDIAANGSTFGGLQFIGTKFIGRLDEVRWKLIRISRHPNTQYEFLFKSGFCIAAASVCHAPGNTR
jgi:hypothetical protein